MRKVRPLLKKMMVKIVVAGCIPADEMKFVLMHLPGKVTYKEVEEMIETVDRNGDGKISFSEFRYIDIVGDGGRWL